MRNAIAVTAAVLSLTLIVLTEVYRQQPVIDSGHLPAATAAEQKRTNPGNDPATGDQDNGAESIISQSCQGCRLATITNSFSWTLS